MWNDRGNFGGGGGFLDNTFSSPSAEGGEKKGKDRRAENCVPVTISQILKSADEFRIGEITVHVVTFVGTVKNIDMLSTKVTYLVEDSTGEIEAVLWLENPVGENHPVLQAYCRVIGTLRVTQGKRHVMVFNIQPISDLNELTSHLLEVVDVHQNAPLWSSVDSSAQTSSTNTVNGPLNNSLMNMNQVDDGLDAQAPTDPQQRKVFKVIWDAAALGDTGVDVQFITKKLNGQIGQDQIRSITDFLLHEGFIFSTIDDEHYTVTR